MGVFNPIAWSFVRPMIRSRDTILDRLRVAAQFIRDHNTRMSRTSPFASTTGYRQCFTPLIADWLVALTNAKKMWGVGLCFLRLRNVKGFKWNQKRVYRGLELNMRIKLRQRLQREKPEPLAVRETPNEIWSMRCRGRRMHAFAERATSWPISLRMVDPSER